MPDVGLGGSNGRLSQSLLLVTQKLRD